MTSRRSFLTTIASLIAAPLAVMGLGEKQPAPRNGLVGLVDGTGRFDGLSGSCATQWRRWTVEASDAVSP